MESVEDSNQNDSVEKISVSAAQRRAEIRRRKLLMNSEDRMNRIVGFTKPEAENNETARRAREPKFHLDLDRTDAWPSATPPKRQSPFLSDGLGGAQLSEAPERRGSPGPGSGEGLEEGEGPRGEQLADEVSRSPRRGMQKYLSRFDEALKLRNQLASESQKQEGRGESEEMDAFRLFRLLGSVVLAIFVRVSVCKYLSVFAPFLTLELAYMGLYKYFPKVEKKMKTTVLTAALLLSGIPAEVLTRSMDTYRKMGDVFADLCVYFFTFILCHELLLFVGTETP